MPPLTGYDYFLQNALTYGWIVPSGGIIMWSGTVASIPLGWKFCNGELGTPDLRNRFIVGVYNDYEGAPKTYVTGPPTTSGGNADHTHTFTGDGHSHSLGPGAFLDSGAFATTVTSLEVAAGTTNQQNTLPVPYYALAYIMKT